LPDVFADTYAILAILKGSKRYQKALDGRDPATTALNLCEAGYALLRAKAATEADFGSLLSPFDAWLVEPPRSVARDAAAFKHGMALAKRDCSLADAWGYATARSLRVPFLTGDESFRGTPHVEFVKE
jgi:predicted nucleic acid-binding protein